MIGGPLIRLGQPLTLLVARLPWAVQTKLLLAFLAIVALLIALGAVGLGVLSGVNYRTAQLIKLERKIAAYRQVQLDATGQLYHVSAALFAADERALNSTLRQLNSSATTTWRLQFVGDEGSSCSRACARITRNLSRW